MPLEQLIREAIGVSEAHRRRREEIARGAGLSRAQWSVLGAAGEPGASVARIARSLGQTRQSVQRVADRLVEAAQARFEPNPDHKRSPLLVPTESGLNALRRLERSLAEWESVLEEHVEPEDLETTLFVLGSLREGLDPEHS